MHSIDELQKELKEKTDKVCVDGKIFLDQVRLELDKDINNQIKNYSSEIKEIITISGIIAPLSLTLFNIPNLIITEQLLLLGFSVLILNIIYSQYIRTKIIKSNDKRISNAEVSWLIAKSDLWSIENKHDELDKTSNLLSYIDSVDKINEYLNLSTTNISIQYERKKINEYIDEIFLFFYIGSFLIILSIIYFPIFNFLFRVISK